MKALYYIIQWTWGLPMNLLGVITFLVARLCQWEYYWYRNAICIVVPWNFGGMEMGMFFVRGQDNESVSAHEYGHSIQNLWWGPLFPVVIAMPSAFRYWTRTKNSTISKRNFACIVCGIAAIVGILITVISALLLQLWLSIIGILIIVYAALMFVWMVVIEIPQYKEYVKYDAVWFEGQATELGNKANQNTWSWL